MLECVVNISEGRDGTVIEAVARAANRGLLDVHADAGHNRSVLTVAGPGVEDAVRAVAREACARIDLRVHRGAHPRLGAVDVVPFVPLAGSVMDHAVAARDRFAAWAASELDVPCFLYGPERSLPEVRKEAFRTLRPDAGPAAPNSRAGAICVGARPVLVAYNVWLTPGTSIERARAVAKQLRSPTVRALGLDVDGRAQVSMNLVSPLELGPLQAYDAVAALAPVERAELVGLLPRAVLDTVPVQRWAELDLAADRTIEARLS